MVTEMNGRSSRSVSCIVPADASPGALLYLERGAAGVHEVQFPVGMLPVEHAIALEGCGSIGASLEDRQAVDDPPVVLRVGLERLDEEPPVGVGRANIGPAHAVYATSHADPQQVSRRSCSSLYLEQQATFGNTCSMNAKWARSWRGRIAG